MGGNFEFAGLSFEIRLPECSAFPTHHLPDEIVRSHYPEVAGRLPHSLMPAITFANAGTARVQLSDMDVSLT